MHLNACIQRYETKDLQDLPKNLALEYSKDTDVKQEKKTLYQDMKQFEAFGVKVKFKKKDK
ncbi:hypothetical protein C0389_06815 [bacterium]|nr:hypothetical protein [bacterium]